MAELKMSVPDEVPEALEVEADALPAEVRMAAAVKLYELRRLSSGAAAQLAGVPRAVFMSKLTDYNVASFRLTAAEVEADVDHA